MDPNLEKRNGILVPRLSPESWEELEHFPLLSDDVLIVTYPKNGTTWMCQIVKLLRTGGKGDETPLEISIPWLEIIDSHMGKVLGYTQESKKIPSPRSFKSHLPYEMVPGGVPHTTPAKYIYVMRNPKDTFVSTWYHRNSMNMSQSRKIPWEEHFEAMMSGLGPFGSWFDHVLGWWSHRDAPNILFLKYEDMKADLLTAVRSVAEFINIENVTEKLLQTVVEKSSFASMKKDNTANASWNMGEGKVFTKDTEFIRKGIVGDWRNHFTEEQNKHFDALYEKKMSGVDLSFQFEQ